MIRIHSLHIYPIKSAAGIALDTAEITARGLRCDRRFMLVDAEGLFITQRQAPRMALVQCQLHAGHRTLRITAPNQDSLTLPLEPVATGPECLVEIWSDQVSARSVSQAANAWFTRVLECQCFLVFMPESSLRPVKEEYIRRPNKDIISFADAFPTLLISTASLDALNTRLEQQVEMARFRPNIVVEGSPCEPHDEDRWESFRVGGVTFFGVKPCDRCVVTTIDPKTGISGREPLATLATYRKRDGKIYFGQNLLHEGSGELRVGQTLEAIVSRPASTDP